VVARRNVAEVVTSHSCTEDVETLRLTCHVEATIANPSQTAALAGKHQEGREKPDLAGVHCCAAAVVARTGHY